MLFPPGCRESTENSRAPRDENRGFGNHTNAGAGCTEVQPCGLRCSRPSFDRDDPQDLPDANATATCPRLRRHEAPVPAVKKGQLVQLRPATRVEEMSDAGLLAACAAADRTARGLLFERHVDAIHRFVARMRGSDADVIEDLVHTTFVRAFVAAGRFRGTSARAWLYGIAANVVREHARREIRRKRALGVVADEMPRAVAQPSRLELARLPAAIAALPHDLRAAFVLVDLEGEKGSDAAAALGIPEGSLWRRVFQARTRLRAALGGDS